jgi:hypothetical protein
MSRKFFHLFLLAFFGAAGNSTVSAQHRSLSLQEVVDAAGVIFSGKVMKVWSERDPVTDFIVTHAQVAVQDAVRGVNGASFTFKQYGGSHEGLNIFLADMSYFSEGEEVVAFLYPASSLNLTSPIGVSEGKLHVGRDPDTGKKIVYGNFLHAKMLQPLLEKGQPPAATAPAPGPIVEYDRFMAFVRQLAQRNSKP